MPRLLQPTVLAFCAWLAFGVADGWRGTAIAETASPPIFVPETRKTVAILSMLGRRMIGIKRGLVVSQVEHDVVEVDWSIDALMLQQIGEALADRFRPAAIELDRQAILQAANKGRSVFSDNEAMVEALAKTAPAGTVDLIVVVRHTVVPDPFTGARTGVSGYGVYVSGLLGITRGRVYLVCSILAIDGARMKEIGERDCAGRGGFTEPPIPFRKLDEPMAKTRLPGYTPEQQEWLRGTLQDMVAETVPRTLAKLKLTTDPRKDELPAAERPPQEESTR